jgi:hypothetical protein
VVGDAVLLDQRDKVMRGEAGEGGPGEVGVGREEVLRRGVDVGEVAAAAAGDEDLFAGAVGVLQDEDAAATAACLDGAHEASGSGSQDEDIDFGDWLVHRDWTAGVQYASILWLA